jgi:hypothetical protein
MNETIKKYNSYLEQLEMILHPNLLGVFMKIHNELVKAEVEQARTFKPSPEWVELKNLIDRMKGTKEKEMKQLLMTSIIKKIETLPVDNGWGI